MLFLVILISFERLGFIFGTGTMRISILNPELQVEILYDFLFLLKLVLFILSATVTNS